jgi:acetyl esterase/lipase
MSHATHEDVLVRETAERTLNADLYVPEDAVDAPAFVTVHGGGWEADHRGMFADHLDALAARGYVGADVTHRLSGDATFPAPVADLKYAIRWLKANADEYGIDPERVAVGGHSSGAHLAALAAVTPDDPTLAPDGAPDASSSVAAAVPMNGPFDLRKLGAMDSTRLFISGFVRRLFGAPFVEAPAAYRQATVQHHVDGSEPPFLLLTATNDEEVPFYESVALRDRLEAAGDTAELFVADGGDHGSLVAGHSHFEAGLARIEAFLDEHV